GCRRTRQWWTCWSRPRRDERDLTGGANTRSVVDVGTVTHGTHVLFENVLERHHTDSDSRLVECLRKMTAFGTHRRHSLIQLRSDTDGRQATGLIGWQCPFGRRGQLIENVLDVYVPRQDPVRGSDGKT